MSKWMVTYNSSKDLMHYGVKGMKWRRRKNIATSTINQNAVARIRSGRRSSRSSIFKKALRSLPSLIKKGGYIFHQYGPGLLLVLNNRRLTK